MEDKEVTFNVFEAMKYPSNHDECHYIDIIENATNEFPIHDAFPDEYLLSIDCSSFMHHLTLPYYALCE